MNHRDTEGTERRGRETGEVIGAAIEVHRALGPGLLESAYEECLVTEMRLRGIPFVRQMALPVEYKGLRVDCSYRIDLMVASRMVVEVKSVAKIEPIHLAQVLTYMKLSRCPLGLLINFNVPILREGIRRLIL